MTIPHIMGMMSSGLIGDWMRFLSHKSQNFHFFQRWVHRSAENKNIKAMAILGFFYYANNRKHDAKLWLRKASEQGNEAAQYLLVRMDS